MDLEERARGRRSKSTLLLRESILEAWEERGGDGGRRTLRKRQVQRRQKTVRERDSREKRVNRQEAGGEAKVKEAKEDLSYQTGAEASQRKMHRVTATRWGTVKILAP